MCLDKMTTWINKLQQLMRHCVKVQCLLDCEQKNINNICKTERIRTRFILWRIEIASFVLSNRSPLHRPWLAYISSAYSSLQSALYTVQMASHTKSIGFKNIYALISRYTSHTLTSTFKEPSKSLFHSLEHVLT